MKSKLIETMHAAGKSLEVVNNADGSVILVSAYGGRILGLFPPDNEENFLWVHPALATADSAKAFLASDEWQNIGGDRTWLAPEVDFFLPKYPDKTVYFQQRSLDPGNYQIEHLPDGRLRLKNQLSLTSSRGQQETSIVLSKTIGPAANPLRHESGFEDLNGLAYAGFTLNTTLELPAPGRQCVGIWNLLQMPHGGDLLIPTYVRTEPKIYFGEISSQDLIVNDQLIIYRMRATGEHKLGIRALASPGRVGYLYSTADDQWALIVRNFQINPSGDYVDVPWDDPDYFGFSTQACNVNSQLGSFSELEYHAPAIVPGKTQNKSEDISQVWAFRGPLNKIQRVTETLLTSHASLKTCFNK